MGQNMTKEAFNELAAWLIRRVAQREMTPLRAQDWLYMAFQQVENGSYVDYHRAEDILYNV